MKKSMLLALVLLFGMFSVALGKVSTRVCLSDGNTPLELADPCIPNVYRDIMVGTKLTIIVSSDVNEYWGDGFGDDGGSLAIEKAYWNYGVLSARDYNDSKLDYEGSHLNAAGKEAIVESWTESGINGFDLYTGSTGIKAGDWFIVDYNAINVGSCNVGFYDHRVDWDTPVYNLVFSHVRTRDFNSDTIVDFRDYAILASHWRETGCNAPKWCDGADLDTNGTINANDLMLFCEFWLEKTK